MGIFATNLVDLYVENRGAMAIIGGEKNWRKYLTIPNILKVRINNYNLIIKYIQMKNRIFF